MSCYGCQYHLENQQAHMMPGGCLNEENIFYLYTDGACRGNPGICTGGAVLYDHTFKVIDSLSILFGIGTNNEAEYKAMLEGLKMCIRNGIDLSSSGLCVRSDSELLVNQLQGIYKIRKENLKILYDQVIATGINVTNIEHVRREDNQVADALANDAF